MERSIQGCTAWLDTLSGLGSAYLWSSRRPTNETRCFGVSGSLCCVNGRRLHDCFPVSLVLQSKEVGVQLQEDLMKVHNELYTVRRTAARHTRSHTLAQTSWAGSWMNEWMNEWMIFIVNVHESTANCGGSPPCAKIRELGTNKQKQKNITV